MINDLKYSLRMLLKSPGFSLIAIATLALGIGANSAIFSVIDTILLRPLPLPEPQQIVMIFGRSFQDGSDRNALAFLDYADIRDQAKSFSAVTAFTRTAGTLSAAEDSQYLEGVFATPELFDVLGVPPLLGRGFNKEDAQEGADRVIVLTYPTWQRAFGGEQNILG